MSKFRVHVCRDRQAAPPPAQQYYYVEPEKRRLGDWHRRGSYPKYSSQVAVDRFGAVINDVWADRFGGGPIEECSTGSCAPALECNFKRYLKRSFENDSIRGAPSQSEPDSVPVSCTSQSSTSDVADFPIKRLRPLPYHDGRSAHVVADREHECARGVPRHSVDPTRISFIRKEYTYNMDSAAESSGSGRHSSQDSNDQINRLRFDYKFASAALEETLLARMETRQKLQDKTPEPERCSHVISPKDLVWGSLKHYIGMVLDRETNSLLGTAVLFTPSPDQAGSGCPVTAKSAWVTSIQAVEGRTEVLIKNYRGVIHVAHLALTSTAVGVALFSVNVCQGTFALAFLSKASGPHRLFADVDRNDRVYVIGYEEPWTSESAATAGARVRPGRIVDAGRHTVVEIDFTTGRLGGPIGSPGGLRGGLVVRADGLVAGVVTGKLLPAHATNIDFSSAYNIYALLEELQLIFPPRP